MGWFGAQELIIIFLIVLLLFGGKKIPEIAKGLGKGIREFKSAKNNLEKEGDPSAESGDSKPEISDPDKKDS